MENYISVLDESFQLATEKVGADEMGALFFDRFFDTYPETKDYFSGTDINYFRGKKLNIIFTFIRDIIKFPNYAEGTISQEVIRHQMYGLKDKEYYFGLADSLVMVMKEILGSDWSPEYETTWNDMSMAFRSIVGEAIEAYI